MKAPNTTTLILAALALASATCARADWTENARLTLKNYAYTKAADRPQGFVCSFLGKFPQSCGCWNKHGKQESQQMKDFCNMPRGCLAKHIDHDGKLKMNELNNEDELGGILGQWGVPGGMRQSFHDAVMFDSATFVSFDFTLKPGTGKVEAHVGVARRDPSGKVFIGWVYGKAKGNLVGPRRRVARAGHCDCDLDDDDGDTECYPGKGTENRGFWNDELREINQGLMAYAFAEAANVADHGGENL